MRSRQGRQNGRPDSRSGPQGPVMEESEPSSAPEVLVEDPAISNKKSQIIALLERSSVLVLKVTNSTAKSWQLPELLHEEYGKEHKKILVTTRTKEEAAAASRTLSRRLKSPLGQLVGFDVDQERKISRETCILYMTAQGFVDKVARTTESHFPWSFVVMDSFNQRSLEDEIAVKLIQKVHLTKLVLLLSEANLSAFSVFIKKIDEDTERLEGWAEQPRIALPISSRLREKDQATTNQIYDVKVLYLGQIYEECQTLKEQFSQTTIELFKGNGDDKLSQVSDSLLQICVGLIQKQLQDAAWVDINSSILVYLPTVELCKETQKLVEALPDIPKMSYDSLILQTTVPDRRQHERMREGSRMVIFTTTIIENTIKIPTLRLIIDFGLTLERSADDLKQMEEERIRWASKSLIRQRSSRVERFPDGVVLRLMPEGFFQYQLYDFSKPEIHRFPLDKLMLKLRETGVGDVSSLFENKDFQPLELKEIEKAEDHLSSQGALSRNKEVTWIGQVYLHMPCNLRLTRLCLFGAVFSCLNEAVIIAALLAQNKSLFRSFKYEPFLDAQKEVSLQQVKMKWDSESDMFCGLKLYLTWVQLHGQKVIKYLTSNTGNSLSRPGPGPEELSWCQENFVDPDVLRDITVASNDMKHALEKLQVHPQFLCSSVDVLRDPEALWPLRLCIAGALTGNYLISDYLIKDEAGRERIKQKIGRDTKDTLLIEQISDAVSSADLEALFRKAWPEARIRAQIVTSNAIVSFQTASEQAIRMALWLSCCSMRHKKGFFVIMKERVRKRTDESKIFESLDVPKEQWAEILRNFPTGQSRAGVRHQVRPIVMEHTVQAIEVFFIPRPMYAHQLIFDDMATRHHVSISEDSVGNKAIEVDPMLKNSHLGVFFQYEYGRNGRMPTAKSVMLMPVRPLMPHLMTLIFSSDIELFTESHKYAGIKFKHSSERIPFDFGFTAQDLAEVNAIRTRISANISEAQMKLGVTDVSLVQDILQLTSKRRPQKVYEMKQWEKLLGEEHPAVSLVTEDSAFSKEFYLLPMIPKLDVADEEEAKDDPKVALRKKKEDVVDGIMRRVKLCEVTQTELICAKCKNCITMVETLEISEEMNESAVFILRNTFGTVEEVKEIGEGEEENTWLQAFKVKIGRERVSWLTCVSHHIFGYRFFGVDYFESQSPVLIRFPTLKEMHWKPELWQHDFHKLRDLTAKYTGEQRKLPINLTCELCDIDLDTRKAFCVHVRTSKEHKTLVKKFLEDVVS